jgi:hypothetical protein
MLVDVTAYQQEQAQRVIDTENGTRSPEPGAPRVAAAPPHPPAPPHPRHRQSASPGMSYPGISIKYMFDAIEPAQLPG